MINKDKIINKVISKTDMLWKELRSYNYEISNFITMGDIPSEINLYCVIALKLSVAELILNTEKYKKLSSLEETKDVSSCIKRLENVIDEYKPDIDFNDIEEFNEYSKNMRNAMWGYLFTQKDSLIDILMSLCESYEKRIVKVLSDEEWECLIDCLMVTFIENSLREKELVFLEKQYGE